MILVYIMLTVYFAYLIISKNRTLVWASRLKEDSTMTDNELELLYIIRTSGNPEETLKIALDLMIDFLEKREAPQDTSSVHPLESA